MSHFASEFDHALDGSDGPEVPGKSDQSTGNSNRAARQDRPVTRPERTRSARPSREPVKISNKRKDKKKRKRGVPYIDLDVSSDSIRTADIEQRAQIMNFRDLFSKRRDELAMPIGSEQRPTSSQSRLPMDQSERDQAERDQESSDKEGHEISEGDASAGIRPPIDQSQSYAADPIKTRRVERVHPKEVSLTNIQASRSIAGDSERFTLGPSMFSSERNEANDGTTTGLNAAMNSHYWPRRKKNRPETAQQASNDPNVAEEQHMGGEIEPGGEGYDSNERILDNIISDNQQENRAPSLLSSYNGEGVTDMNVPSPLASSMESAGTGKRRTGIAAIHMPGIPELDEIETSRPDNELRPRDPHEIDVPIVFRVPVDDMDVEYESDEDVDQGYLEQQLEWSESESDEESDLGSVADMLDDDTDESYSEDDAELRLPEKELEKEWRPRHASDGDSDGSDFSAADNDGQLEALTESESDFADSDFETPNTVADERRRREKRHRICTLHYWDGERIEYVPEDKLGLLTAVSVRRVIPAVKTYRARRMNPRRRAFRSAELVSSVPLSGTAGDAEVDADAALMHQDIRVPVFDPRDRQWHTETVAKSMMSTGFEPLIDENGAIVPLVYRSNPFGNVRDDAPFNLYMLRIAKGGVYTRMLENSRSTLYLGWSGKCAVQLNTERFDLPKGIAVFAPPANDLYIDNGSHDSDEEEEAEPPANIDANAVSFGMVTLLVIEFDGSMSQEAVQAMARGAASMISGQLPITEEKPHDASIGDDVLDQSEDYGVNEIEPIGFGNAVDEDVALNEDILTDNVDRKRENEEHEGKRERPRKPGREHDSLDSFAISFANAVGNPEVGDRVREAQLRERRILPSRVRPANDDERFSESLSLALGGGGGEAGRRIAGRPWSRAIAESDIKVTTTSDDGAALSEYLTGRTKMEDRFRGFGMRSDLVGQEDLNNSQVLQDRIRRALTTAQHAKRARSEEDEDSNVY